MTLPLILRKKSNLILLLIAFLTLALTLFAQSTFFQSFSKITVNSPPSEVDPSKVEQVRNDCFAEVGEITEKDATQFNEFRSLSDFRLFKYRECLKKGGVEPDL